MKAQKPQLTVEDLMFHLRDLPGDALVKTEGCDCDGILCGVEMEDGKAYLRRRNGAAHVVGDGYGDDHEYEDAE